VARAKRTDRADARRRYRAAPAPAGVDSDDGGLDSARLVTPRAGGGAPAGRGGLAGLFGAITLPNVRQDVAAMPSVIRSTPGIWAALALGVAAVVAGLTFPLNDTGALGFVLPLFIQAPGIPVLVGGFVAPRGAWLIGGVLGSMQALGLLSAIYRATPASLEVGSVAIALASGAILGALFAALASWYRRWLRTMSTRNAAARAEREKQQRRDPKRSTRPAR
jgi:hypothetical protein